jgi:hypothetical protein
MSSTTLKRLGWLGACAAVFISVIMLSTRQLPAPQSGAAEMLAPASTPDPERPAAAVPAPARLADVGPVAHREEPSNAAASPAVPAQADVAEWVRQAMPVEETTAEENESRGDAIRKLGASPSPDAISALAYALRNDADVRNRILAVNSLRRSALAGNGDSAIVSALREASNAADSTVASVARDALSEIERARSPR